MTNVGADSLYGTLNLLVLRCLAGGEKIHGLDIQRRIQALSEEALRIEVGALYPALHRLEADGLLESEWGISERRRRAKFYEITRAGLERLEQETASWEAHTAAVGRVLNAEAGRTGS